MRNFLFLVCLACFGIINNLWAQDVNILRGKVVDAETRLPISGVSIVAGERGVESDSAGSFSIPVTIGASVTASYVGYVSKSIVAGSENNIVIELQPDSQKGAMDEVVVQGFRTTTRKLQTAASSMVTADDIKDVPVANVMDLLQGKIAGVNIQNNNAMPGARGSIFQRGLSSVNVTGSGEHAYLEQTQPLFIIDGVPIDVNEDYEYGFAQAGPQANPLSVIPAEDIESVEVLKDAAATAVYGSRGANGVWIINTKRGRSGKPEVNYVGNVYVSLVPRLRDVNGGIIERQMRINSIINGNINEDIYWGLREVNRNFFLSDSLNPYYNNSTNWQGYFHSPTVNQSHNVSFKGNPNLDYKVNMGYINERGIVHNTGFERFNLNMNSSYRAGRKFSLFGSINTANTTSNKGSSVGLLQTGVANSGMASTLLPPPDIFSQGSSAISAIRLNSDDHVRSVITSMTLVYELVRNLSFNSQGSMEYKSETSNAFYPSYLNNNDFGISVGTDPRSQYNSYSKITNNYYNRNMLTYRLQVGKKHVHTFSPYLFNDVSVKMAKSNQMALYGTPNDYIMGPYGYNLAKSYYGILGDPLNVRVAGYGGSLHYDLNEKYILNFDLRYDATSTNGPAIGFQPNPSVSGKWNFYLEEFVKKINWFTNGAIRASWGRSITPQGNIFSLYGSYLPAGSYMGHPTVDISYTTSPNPYFKPKSSTQFNFGLDIASPKRVLALQYDAYYKAVEDMAWSVPLPSEAGYVNLLTNDISMVNWGHELALTVNAIRKKDLNWSVNLNAAFNKNTLTKLPEGWREMIALETDAIAPVLYKIGKNSLSNVMYYTNGVYGSIEDIPINPLTGRRMYITIGRNSALGAYAMPGDPRFVDLNGDYVINNLDRVSVGDPQPKVTGGLSTNFSYKAFQLTLNSSFTLFRDVLNTPLARKLNAYYSPASSNYGLPPLDGLNIWYPGNEGAVYPYPYDYEQNARIDAFRYNQTLFMEDGSYFKILSTTLGYNFNKDMLNRIRVKSLRMYITGYNLLILTKYSGPNPETVSDMGRDYIESYPAAKKVAVGMNLTF